MAGIFISYRRDDSAGYAGRLYESLTERFGPNRIFRDVDTLRPGQDFLEAIEQQLGHSKVFLVLIGKEWLNARDASGQRRLDQQHDYVRLEIAAALQRPGVLLIPVIVEGAAVPSPEEVPSDISALSRRQAISLRDETWDQDVDRLAKVASEADGAPSLPGRTHAAGSKTGGPVSRRWIAPAVAVVAVAALAVILMRVVGSRAPFAPGGEPSSEPQPRRTAVSTAPASAIAIPRIAEIAQGDLIYTLIAGSIRPQGAASALRLRFRFSNEGRYDANFGDASFRLAIDGDVVAPTSGLDEVVAAHSLRQGIVTFEIPSGAKRGVLRVGRTDDPGELSLDLSGAGGPAQDEHSDAGDALSRAIVAPVLSEPRPLIVNQAVAVTLRRVTSRRFANTVRLICNVVLANRGRYPFATSALTLRAVDEGSVAPFKAPSEVVQAAADFSAEYVFDLPPTTTKVVLRASGFGETGDVPLELR
jgi:TIR domain